MSLVGRENNFDLIRLGAASQVVVWHSIEHFKIEEGWINVLYRALGYFPGVPIFFTISGFLIYRSLEKQPLDLKKYFKNRLVRIYPGLLVCLGVTIALLLLFGVINFFSFFKGEIILWILAQASVAQFYTPDILRTWGVGTPNGALWTITVEIQFYILLALIILFWRKWTDRKILFLLSLIVLSILSNVFIGQLPKESMLRRLLAVTVFPYFYFFSFGVLISYAWRRIDFLFQGRALYWIIAYGVYSAIFSFYLNYYYPSYWFNGWNLPASILLACLVISIAFTKRSVSKKLLADNDLSYGVYLYHMLVINSCVELDFKRSGFLILGVLTATYVLSFASWKWVERPILILKRNG